MQLSGLATHRVDNQGMTHAYRSYRSYHSCRFLDVARLSFKQRYCFRTVAIAFTGLVLNGLFAAAAYAQLPSEVEAELVRAKIPRDAVSIVVADAQPTHAAARINHRGSVLVQPASVMKLITTYAALDVLGPAFTWTTPVFIEGTTKDGVLNGSVYLQGQGDPKMVVERVWLLLRRLQGLGIKTIKGDIVIDRSAFEVPEVDPASFDGEPLRPYNAAPDAFLVNYKSVVMTFTPDLRTGLAFVQYDPPLAGVTMASSVPLSNTACSDYRGTLKADFLDPKRIRFLGSYPASCGERIWPVAYSDPSSYAMRALHGMWLEAGGRLEGVVRLGPVPTGLRANKPSFESTSAPLAEIVRDINKYSNNVMAQQLFLTLGRDTPQRPASFEASRAMLNQWWRTQLGADDVPVLDNGSGLSRSERASANALTRLLQKAYASPVMSELMASLPITGLDGTLKRSKANAVAHLKTGSLNGVSAIAGYVDGQNGKRYAVVAIVNHPNAHAARPAFDALVDWAAKD